VVDLVVEIDVLASAVLVVSDGLSESTSSPLLRTARTVSKVVP